MINGVVIFDFDGTLTVQPHSLSMWGQLWKEIGKSQTGASLYAEFHNGLISRKKWFEITEQEFLGQVNKSLLLKVTQSISLRKGAFELIDRLAAQDYELHILSGGINTIIHEILRDRCNLFKNISANDIIFNDIGEMVCLKMTPYDYEGKSQYIASLIDQHSIPYERIFYVGNSVNDLSVLSLPIKTICISPIDLLKEQVSQWSCVCDDLEGVTNHILG